MKKPTYWQVVKTTGIYLLGFIAALILSSQIAPQFVAWLDIKVSNVALSVTGITGMVCVLASYCFISLRLEAKGYVYSELGWHNLYAFILGCFTVAVTIGTLYLCNWYQILTMNHNEEWVIVFFAFVAQAITQEVLLRGILFRQWIKRWPARRVTLCLSLVLACVASLIGEFHPLAFISEFLTHVILCFIYLRTGSVITCGLAYCTWLYGTFLTGVLDEHWRSSAPLSSLAHSEVALSGHIYGPESSLIGIAVLTLVATILYKKQYQIDR